MKILLIVLFILLLQLTTLLFADWGNEEKVIPSDGAADDYFGRSISISGNYAVIGAFEDDDNSGSAYIYNYDGSNWSQQAKLLASDGSAEDGFGYSVSICGNYAIIGAWKDDVNGNDSGSAYIFHRSGISWFEQAKLTTTDSIGTRRFSRSVSISGDYVIIGADYGTLNTHNVGCAYIFHREGTSWNQQIKLTASDGTTGDWFGKSVSISGDYAVVGAHEDDDNGYDSGSAYIFYRSGSGWIQQAKITASDGDYNDRFGGSVSISGDYLVIGVYCDEENGETSGSAYIFHRNGTCWSQEVKLTATDGNASDYFGNSVSISGDYAIVGAWRDDNNGWNSGSAYLFYRNGTSWSQENKLTAFDSDSEDYFGCSVSVSGEKVVIGALADDDNGSCSGSAYFFENLNTAVSPSSVQEIEYPELKSAYPNPFNPSTTISFSVPQTSSLVNLEIYNIRGQKIKTLPVTLSGVEGSGIDNVNTPSPSTTLRMTQAGSKHYSVFWNGTDQNDQPVSSGIYLYKLNVNGKTEAVKKCLFLK